ncbi:MAG: alpha/beta hydrolase [Colwellia sp.]|nr:alpha/beta hydrolase [Colwellia sp.]
MTKFFIYITLLTYFITTTVLAETVVPQVKSNCLNSQISGEGQAILLIPGFVSDHRVWNDVAKALSKSYQVHNLSIAGFGAIPACEQADDIFQQTHDEINAYIKDKHLNKPIVIGHSLGGLMAFKLALNNNTRLLAAISVDGLPFIGPIFTGTNTTKVNDLNNQALGLKAMNQHASSEQLRAMTERNINIQTTIEEKQQLLLTMAQSSDPITAGSAIYTVMTTDLRADLNKLKIPMLLVGASGGFSTHEQQQAAEYLYQQQLDGTKQVSLIMNTNGRHFLMWEQQLWLINLIEKFIEQQS